MCSNSSFAVICISFLFTLDISMVRFLLNFKKSSLGRKALVFRKYIGFLVGVHLVLRAAVYLKFGLLYDVKKDDHRGRMVIIFILEITVK